MNLDLRCFGSHSIWIAGLLILSMVATPVQAANDDWPEFRGPLGNGHATATNLPVEFDDSTNLKWKRRIPGCDWRPDLDDDRD